MLSTVKQAVPSGEDMEIIDREFIALWHPRYETTERDEMDYCDIRDRVRAEFQDSCTVTQDTFRRILTWKSPRLKGIVKMDSLGEYLQIVAEVGRSLEGEQLRLLLDLHGIGVPTASTILHFIYPDHFPILDVRTVEVLFEAGHIHSLSTGPRAYPPFCSAIRRISSALPEYSLRDIDRALFAYHKVGLKRTTLGRSTPLSKLPLPRQTRQESGEDPMKITNHERLASVFASNSGLVLSTAEIRHFVEQQDPGFSSGSIRPNDHALGNKAACWCAATDERLFDRISRGRYRVR